MGQAAVIAADRTIFRPAAVLGCPGSVRAAYWERKGCEMNALEHTDTIEFPRRHDGRGPAVRRGFKVWMVVGGAGLLACVVCCAVPILGAVGLVSGVMVGLEVLEPLSVGLLALGAIAAVVTFVRSRRSGCAKPASAGASCSAGRACGCGAADRGVPGAAER